MSAPAPVIAIVDDDPRILESLTDLLESAGYAVRCFATGQSLLGGDAFAVVHCVITDIGMPGMNGFELRRQARARRPHLPVILLTGRYDILDRARSADSHEAVFAKPFDGPALLTAVAEALRSGRRSPGG